MGRSLGDLTFDEAHWILAFFYFKMAKNMPRVINSHQGNAISEVKSYIVLYWAGIIFNAVFPLIQCVFLIIEAY